MASTIRIAARDLGEVQLPRLGVGDLHDGEAEAAEDLEVDAGVPAHVGDRTEQDDERLHAALRQRASDDEAVSAVAAAAAQDGHASGERILEGCLDRRDDLPPGVLHQHERRNADVFDRPAIRLAHLLRVEYPHARERAYPVW